MNLLEWDLGFGFEWLMLSSNIIEGNLWPLSVEGRGLLVIASDWIGAGNLITKLLTSSILLTHANMRRRSCLRATTRHEEKQAVH